MAVRALRAGLRNSEVPSFEAPRRYCESPLRTMRDGWRVLRTLLIERFRRQHEVQPPAPASVSAPASLPTSLGAAPPATVADAALSVTSLAQDCWSQNRSPAPCRGCAPRSTSAAGRT